MKIFAKREKSCKLDPQTFKAMIIFKSEKLILKKLELVIKFQKSFQKLEAIYVFRVYLDIWSKTGKFTLF